MDFKVGHCSSKDVKLEARWYTPEEASPPTNKVVQVLSKYGCGRQDIFNPNFDTHWSPLIPRPAKKKKENV